MMTTIGMDVRKGEHLFNLFMLVGMQTGAAIMETNVESPPKAWNRSITWSSSSIPGHIPKSIYILLQIYLLTHVHWCFFHNTQEAEIVFQGVHQFMNQ